MSYRTRRWRFWRTSLRRRLVTYFLLVSLPTLLLAVGLAFLGVRQALHGRVHEQLGVVATLENQQLERWLKGRIETVLALASSASVVEDAALLLSSDAPRAVREQADKRLDAHFRDALAIRESLSEILILSSEGGQVILSTEPAREGEYRVRDSYFTEGLKGTHLAGVYPSPLTFEPTFTISTPLRHLDNTLGVLAVRLNLAQLDRVVARRADLGVSGESYLVDQYGEFVSSTRFGRDDPLRGVHTEGVNAALEKTNGSALYENYLGVPVIGAYRWIEDLRLALLVEVPQAEAFAPARAIAEQVLAIGAVLVLLLTLGILFAAREIAEPILNITEAAVRVHAGDLEAAAEETTVDEIGTLARVFNAMTARLHQLVGELETKNAELERFTYTVSHDLKSPLVTISGFLPLLRADCASGDLQKVDDDIEKISSAAGKMSRDLEGLLDLAKIGRVTSPPEDCSLENIVRESLELVRGEIYARGVDVEVREPLPWVRVDPARLREVCTNLVGNAVKFMGDVEKPRVEIGAETRDGEVLCYLKDNGIGIAAGNQEKIFGLFERLEGKTSGSGIGLAVAQRIVEIHGGHIWVESPGPGQGSTFYFTVPPATGEGRDPPAASSKPHP